jgi:hypothetical protein
MLSSSASIEIESNMKMEPAQLKKMIFIMNALEEGWSVKKKNDAYIFSKKHENRKEIFMESYLENFILSNMLGKKFIL